MKSHSALSRVNNTPHPALMPLKMAARAIDARNWLEAQNELDSVSAQLVAQASVLGEDLRQRHESMALRLADHAKTLRERLHQISPTPSKTPPPTLTPAAHEGDMCDVIPLVSELGLNPGFASLSSIVCPPAIRALVMARFVLPLRHPVQAARYRQRVGGGLLLFGPPGTGKTHLVRWLGKELGLTVFTASPAQLMSKWVGDSEKQLAELFAKARQEPAALVFVDEIDVLAPSRDQPDVGGSGVMQRLLAQMLNELDGFEEGQGGLLFVGATNRPWVLDKALLRPGRFDAMAYLGVPGRAARVTLLKQALTGMPVQKDMAWQTAGEALKGRTTAEVVAGAHQAARCAFERSLRLGSDQDVLLEDLLRAASDLGVEDVEGHQRFSDFAVQHGAVWPTEEEGGVEGVHASETSFGSWRFD